MKRKTSSNSSTEAFVKDLRQVMELLDISQKEIAETLGVRSNHINLYFKSKSDIHSAKLLLILNYLGIDVHHLVKRKIAQLSGGKSAEVSQLALRVRRLKKGPRESILRLVEQLTS